MAKKPMKATPANVGRLLRAAGHMKRRSIRGWKNWSSGFKCEGAATEATGEPYIKVRYLVDGHYDPAPASAKRARVEQYLPALSAHFFCEVIEPDIGTFALKVTEKIT
jgi:hypothetical protein